MAVSKTTTKQPIYNKIDEAFGGNLPGGVKPAGAADPQAAADKAASESCRAQGGQWDPVNRVCVMPQAIKNQTETKAPETTNKDQVFRDESGRPAGITIGGKTYLGLSPSDVEKMAATEEAKKGGPATQAFETGAIAQQQAAQQQQIMNNLSPEVLASDGRQVVQPEGMVSKGATIAAAGGGAVVGAKAGAALGTLVAPGIGTVIGGIVGGIGGAIGGAYAKMKVQKLQDVKEATKTFSQAKTNKNEILNMVNAGLVTEGQARELWREEKMNIISSYAYLKSQTQNDLNNFLSSPGDELIQIESYLALDGLYDLEFEKALMLPNPSKIRIMPTEQ